MSKRNGKPARYGHEFDCVKAEHRDGYWRLLRNRPEFERRRVLWQLAQQPERADHFLWRPGEPVAPDPDDDFEGEALGSDLGMTRDMDD